MNDEIKEILHLLERCDNTYLKIENSNGEKEYEYHQVNDLRLDGYHSQLLLNYITNLQKENERLKFWLNDVIFDVNNNDVELPARYLRKLGYIDFDDEKQVYTNKHNNEPFWQKEYKEKVFILKDDELDDYTKQLEFKIKILATIIDKSIEYSKNCLDNLTTIDEEEAKPFKCIHNNYLKILNGGDEE